MFIVADSSVTVNWLASASVVFDCDVTNSLDKLLLHSSYTPRHIHSRDMPITATLVEEWLDFHGQLVSLSKEMNMYMVGTLFTAGTSIEYDNLDNRSCT